MKKSRLLFALAALTFIPLVACQPTTISQNSQATRLDHAPTNIDHYYSDKISFADMNWTLTAENNRFMRNKVAKLKLKSVTDGDTAVFYLDGEKDGYTNPLAREYDYVTVRFLAIDTPESTSSIAPWGKKASKYVKDKLMNAEGIIVDASSVDTSNTDLYPTVVDTYRSNVRLDSNGTRWLAVVWYCPDGGDPNDYTQYRCLQLDVIEECYSYYTGNLGSGFRPYVYTANRETEPILYEEYSDSYGSLLLSDVLLQADIRMQTLGVRKTGNQIDPDYDYSKTPTEASIKEAYENFDTWENEGKFVSLTGVITRFIGSNFYFQDKDGYALYVYMGIDAKSIGSMFSVGDTIQIRGRLATYGGQKQLSDVVWARETFTKITDADKVVSMPSPISLNNTSLTIAYLDQYIGKLVTMNVTGRSVGQASKDYSYTLYATNVITDLGGDYNRMSVRVNGTLNPGYDREEYTSTWASGNYRVTGIMSIYLEEDATATENYPSYQITVGNREQLPDGSFQSEIVKI